jgi:hypothetical protein
MMRLTVPVAGTEYGRPAGIERRFMHTIPRPMVIVKTRSRTATR